MTKRTDIHRPGAIVPAHYTHWQTYSLATMDNGWPVPAIGIDCATPYTRVVGHDAVTQRPITETVTPVCADSGRCCVASIHRHAKRDGRAVFGAIGKCGVCGANYIYGSVFRYSNGEIVHMGHDCATKYECMYDMSAWEIENNRTRAALATQIRRSANDRERAEFLAAHDGLEDDLALGRIDGTKQERILADIAGKFVSYRSLSDKQIAFVRKLANEIRTPPTDRPVERHAVAPVGKGIEFMGEIVSVKRYDDDYRGTSLKATIKVTTNDGVWLAWGTLPSALKPDLWDASWTLRDVYVGRRVSIKATLFRPSPRDLSDYETDDARERAAARNAETHFVIMQRPSGCYVDVYGPRYEIPKCILGETCRIIRDWRGEETVCDGSCRNVAKARKPRRAADASPSAT